jgi:dolichyl-phosphate-mannose--protein O-mannosyl transferase
VSGAAGWTITGRELGLLGAIVVLAAAVRLVGINYPPRTAVDEFWYARDGCFYWKGSVEGCGMGNLQAPDRDVRTWLTTYGELTPEHPPLAKWLIGAPMSVLCYCPGAWRLAPAAAGILTVVLLYLLSRLAFGSTLAAAAAAGLLAIDYPHVIHSRLATLEIFLALFAVAAFYFCLLDRQQILRRARGQPAHRYWRYAAGVAGGAAAASKLSGVAVVVAVLLLVAAWELAANAGTGQRLKRIRAAVLSVIVPLAVVPAAMYLATYAGRLHGTLLAAPWAEGSWVRAFVERQLYILSFHADKPAGLSSPWALPMTSDPLAYVVERTETGMREILLFGNPLLWWGGFAAVIVAAVFLIRSERAVAAAVVVVGFLASYAGWLSITLTGRPVHLFYAVPVAPFLYLALGLLAALIATARGGRMAIAAVLALSAIAFVFYLPIVIGWPLQEPDWQLRACSAQVLWLEPVEGCTIVSIR